MKILKRHKTGIPKKYIFITAMLFSLAVIIQVSGAEQNPSPFLFAKRIILFGSVYLFWALFLDYINALIKPFEKDQSVLFQIIARLISSFLLVFINLLATNIIYYSFLITATDFTFSEIYLDFKPYILKSVFIRFFDLIVIGFILKLIGAQQTLQKQKLKLVSLENQLHISQLEALRNQLDPHFLFNTLHTLNTLIGYDDKKAKSMVIKVTNLLRKILDKREKQLTPFDEEIDYFKNHLEIEEERFHDRLEVSIDVEDKTREFVVPTLMLQPLIENAFKHGIAQIEGEGLIKLKSFFENGFFIVKLSNSVPDQKPLKPLISTKVGLQNLNSRLRQVYGDDYHIKTEKVESTFTVTLKIKRK